MVSQPCTRELELDFCLTFILTEIVTCSWGHPDRHGGPHPGCPGGGGYGAHGSEGGGLQPEIFRI